jgi:hypothetical protein
VDLRTAYDMLVELDRSTLSLAMQLHPQSKVDPDQRIAAAEAILMLQKDRKLMVAEIMTAAYGSTKL